MLSCGMIDELFRFIIMGYAGRLPSLYREDLIAVLYAMIVSLNMIPVQDIISRVLALDKTVYSGCVGSIQLREELGTKLATMSGDLKKFKAALKIMLPK